MQDASKDLGYMRRDIRQICLFEPVDCGMSNMSITRPANKGENIAQRVCVERILYNSTAEKTRRRRYGLIRSGYLTLILNLYFFVTFLPSTFYPRLFTLDFLPSPSTFYTRPRLFTLALDILPSTLDTRPIDKLLFIG